MPTIEVRRDKENEPVILNDVTVWCDHTGAIKYYFDQAEADRWIRFVERFGRHTVGKLRGERIKLEDWQRCNIREFFGWRCIGTALRRYFYWLWYVPRKNGKSLIIAVLLLGILLIDREKAPEIYDIGSAKDQSDTIFEMMQLMCGWEAGKEFADETLMEKVEPTKNLLKCKGNGGTIRTMPFSPGAFHGKNPHFVLAEEYHEHPSDEMKEVGETGQGSRDQPGVIIDTTAGKNKNTPCYEELLLARKIVNGSLVMPNYLPMVFEAPKDAPWHDVETAKYCNPQFGKSLNAKFFEDQIAMCREKPQKKYQYIRLQLNRFIQDKNAAFDYDDWIKGRARFDFRQFRNSMIFGGMDLAAVRDLCALITLCAPNGKYGDWYFNGHFWCPQKVIEENSDANYKLWQEQGFIVGTAGNATDYNYIEKQILDYHKYFNYKLLNADMANATHLSNDLINNEGVPIEYIGQGWRSMTEPIKWLQTLVLSGRLKHNNPVMEWMVQETILEGTDHACKFSKLGENSKIDGMVALAMAVAAALRCMSDDDDDPFARRGLLVA